MARNNRRVPVYNRGELARQAERRVRKRQRERKAAQQEYRETIKPYEAACGPIGEAVPAAGDTEREGEDG